MSSIRLQAFGIEEVQKRSSNSALASSSKKVQRTMHDTSRAAASTQLSVALCELVFAHGLSDAIPGSNAMKRVLKLAREAPSTYVPPDKDAVRGKYLDQNCSLRETRALKLVRDHSEIYGCSLLSDGATVHGCSLVNILAGIPISLPPVMEIVDCTDHLASGGSKDSLFLTTEMIPVAERIGSRNVYLYILDGASNERSSGEMLEEKYPWTTLLHGSEHVLSLAVGKVCKIPEFAELVEEHGEMYS